MAPPNASFSVEKPSLSLVEWYKLCGRERVRSAAPVWAFTSLVAQVHISLNQWLLSQYKDMLDELTAKCGDSVVGSVAYAVRIGQSNSTLHQTDSLLYSKRNLYLASFYPTHAKTDLFYPAFSELHLMRFLAFDANSWSRLSILFHKKLLIYEIQKDINKHHVYKPAQWKNIKVLQTTFIQVS